MRIFRYALGFMASILLVTACNTAPPAAPVTTSIANPSRAETASPAIPITTPTANPYGAEVVSKLNFDEPRGIIKGFDALWLNIYGDSLFRLDPVSGDKQVTITDGIGKEPAQCWPPMMRSG